MRLASPLSTSIKAITGVGIIIEKRRRTEKSKMLLATGKEYFVYIYNVYTNERDGISIKHYFHSFVINAE